ncbi:MAG: FAD-binding oxidoreductase [Patescibacteria group bacterium]
MNQVKLYKIIAKIKDARDVFIWQASPMQGEIFDFQPGQFAIIHLFDDTGATWLKKPYSIASSPINKEYLEFGIKTQGEFTQKMNKVLEIDDAIGIEGPYGIFTFDPKIHQNIVMFAGGIGITPFISMIRFAAENSAPVKILLCYCNQTEHDIAYKDALDKLALQNPNFQIIYFIDACANDKWIGEIGLISEEKIKKYITDYQDKYIFLCGPVPFMKVVESIVKSCKVPNDRIKKEIF